MKPIVAYIRVSTSNRGALVSASRRAARRAPAPDERSQHNCRGLNEDLLVSLCDRKFEPIMGTRSGCENSM
jgi:hypothetical protein